MYDSKVFPGTKVGLSERVREQTRGSRHSYFDGKISDVAIIAEQYLEAGTQGEKEGVLLVPVPAEGFFSGMVEMTTETHIVITFEPCSPGEAPFARFIAPSGPKLTAKGMVVLVLRHKSILSEFEGTMADGSDWLLTSFEAHATEEPAPLHPAQMARSVLGLYGVTPTGYTVEDYAKSINFWGRYCTVG